MTASILRVAVNAPLPTLFDYLPPANGPLPAAGSRVLVPFGRRREVGVVMETAQGSDVPVSRLRAAVRALDDEPVFDDDAMWLIHFVANYYHHPIGEVVAAALPAILRHGRPLYETVDVVLLTDEGRAMDVESIARRAPKQAAVLEFLQRGDSVPVTALDDAIPNWRATRKALLEKGWMRIEASMIDKHGIGAGWQGASASPLALNTEQRSAVDRILASDGFATTLLDGVTGSGKTEVYLRVMESVLSADRQVLILVPEIGLTPQFVRRLEARVGSRPALLHSGLTDLERLDAWRRARDGSASVVLGTRSAAFVPLARPGLVIVDEEHDVSFKQQEGLRYSARDVAIARAKRLDIPVILGSATPSLDSLRRVRDGAYNHVELTQRAGGALPPHIRLVDINRYRSDDGLSQPLLSGIASHLDKGGQVLIYLNRRGFAPTLICHECGHIAECRRCDSRMTVHRRERALQCHHCGAGRPLDDACTECGGPVVPLGEGTERIEDALTSHFPQFPVTRVDSDTTRLKGTMDRALASAVSGEARILVGTQMLSKGHHFPKLTLVGVVNADQGLFSTDFRGGERLAQSLVQVAGRAGRVRQQGEVLIQTAFPEHAFWKALLTGGYQRVAEFAMAERAGAGWPPFSRVALLRASAHKRELMLQFLNHAADVAQRHRGTDVRILGPVAAPMERRAGRFRGQLLLQSSRRQPLHALLGAVSSELSGDRLARKVRWSIDVDPIELF